MYILYAILNQGEMMIGKQSVFNLLLNANGQYILIFRLDHGNTDVLSSEKITITV